MCCILWDKVFNAVPGTVNVYQDNASWATTYKQENEDDEVSDSERMPSVPDTSSAGDGTSHVTFHDPLTSRVSIINSLY